MEEEDASTAWLGFLKKGSLEMYVSEGNRYITQLNHFILERGPAEFCGQVQMFLALHELAS